MTGKNALIIIAKYPRKENVMTRLKGVMPDDKRLCFYESFLKKAVLELRSIPLVDTFIAFAPAHSEGYFSRFGLGIIPLPPGDLGTRMFYAFQAVFDKGYCRAALVGVDIPDLRRDIITKAFHLLSSHDVVFGPAEDGGYYLVGISSPIREIFEDVPWSSAETLQKSLEKARLHRYRVGFTDTLSDIDTPDDLRKSGYSPPGHAAGN